MEEKIIDEEEAELYGFKRKIVPVSKPLSGEEEPPMSGETAEEEVPLSAKLDEGYTFDGYMLDETPVEFPETEEDDESLVMLSPEEAAAAVRAREEKLRKEKELCARLTAEGAEALDKGDFEKARECFTQANEFDDEDLEINVGYMRAYSEDFTDLEDVEALDEVYRQCYDSAGDAFAKRIQAQFGERLQAALEETNAEKEEKGKIFTDGQSARREEYAAIADKRYGNLLKWGAPLVVVAVATVIFLCFITAIEGALFVVLAAVCLAATVALLIPTVLAARKAVEISRLQSENERLDTTDEGRELLLLQEKIDFLQECLQK